MERIIKNITKAGIKICFCLTDINIENCNIHN
jgi:hypothetical protein